MSTAPQLGVDEAKRLLDSGQALILDVVSSGVWADLDGAIPGALRMAPEEFEERAGELPKERAIIAYCT